MRWLLDARMYYKEVKEALEELTASRAPRLSVELAGMSGSRIFVKASGVDVVSLGVYEWVGELLRALERKGVRVVVELVLGPEDPREGWRLVVLRFVERVEAREG